jgi:hypothetical protein
VEAEIAPSEERWCPSLSSPTSRDFENESRNAFIWFIAPLFFALDTALAIDSRRMMNDVPDRTVGGTVERGSNMGLLGEGGAAEEGEGRSAARGAPLKSGEPGSCSLVS